MAYSLDVKERAIKLRKLGFSLNEISQKLGVSKSTSSLWLNSIILNKKAQSRLLERQILGQYKTMLIAKEKKQNLIKRLKGEIAKSLVKINQSKELYKLLASILFWTEGGRSTDSYVFFVNSDPKMVSFFVFLLRNAFDINETKFRCMLHVHEYHNENKQLHFWSNITKIPINQFSRSYHKPHTGKRIRDGYQGSIRVRYYDSKIALELRAFYNTFVDGLGL